MSSRHSLPRSISSANLSQTERCREYIKKAWVKERPPLTNYFNTTPCFTLTIPPLKEYHEKEFREFVFKRIINYNLKEDLEAYHTINWCPGTSDLLPLYTIGDGNCLLHAASLSMWGFQDRDYTLRKAVYHAVERGKENSLYTRWKAWRQRELRQLRADLEPQQWEREWSLVVRAASLETSHNGSMGYLEEFHIFTLCNVLRRPIFLYSPSKIHSREEGVTLQRIEYYGIYLPLLWEPQHCIKNPLPIVFYNGHFSAVSIIDEEKQYYKGSLLFPLIDYFGQDLPVRFTMKDESQSHLKRKYLTIESVPAPSHSYYIKGKVPCAKLEVTDQPKYMKPLLAGFIDRCLDAFTSQKETPVHNSGDCRSGCGFTGSAMYDGYCSNCYKKVSSRLNDQKRGGASGGGYRCDDRSDESHRADWRKRSPHNVQENDLEVSTVLCSNNCNRVGFAQYLGMCEECYGHRSSSSSSSSSSQHYASSSSKQHPSSTSTTQQVTSSQLPPMGSDESRPCRTPGCDFFGKANMKFYCSQCFEENMSQILESGPPSSALPPPLPSTGSDSMPLCYNCKEFHANPEYGGTLCSNCFKDKTKREVKATQRDVPPTHRREVPPTHRREVPPTHERELLPTHREVPPTHHREVPPAHREVPPTHQDIPPTHEVELLPTHREVPPTHNSCILCDDNVPIVEVNYICRKHAVKCRLKHRSPEPLRDEYRPSPDPARNEYRRSPDPARNEYRPSPDPSRNEYRPSPDPTRDESYSPDPPVRYDRQPVVTSKRRNCQTFGCTNPPDEGYALCEPCYDRYYGNKPHPPHLNLHSRRTSEPQLTRYSGDNDDQYYRGAYTPQEHRPLFYNISEEKSSHPLNTAYSEEERERPVPAPRVPRNKP